MVATAAAAFDKITKRYPVGALQRRYVSAVEEVSFRIEPGQVFGLLGPNRAGKTTLIKLLLSLCRPTAGAVTRLGQAAADRRTLGRIGYVHENHAFPRYLTAAGLLEYYGGLTLVPAAELRHRVPALLERVGLADRSREPIARYSKGRVQRLGLAQALINEPDLLVLDEPLEGLDLAGRQLLRQMVAEQRRQGRTVLLVSHALTEVEHLCDRVAVLRAGRLIYTGTVAGLTQEPRTGTPRSLEQALEALYARSGP
jgi:ABC-2 type transport system ATP-binding protein